MTNEEKVAYVEVAKSYYVIARWRCKNYLLEQWCHQVVDKYQLSIQYILTVQQ